MFYLINNKKMFVFTGIIFIFSLCCFSEIPGEFEKLENIMNNIGKIRQEISYEKQKWNSDYKILEEEKKLLLKECEYLDNEIEKMQNENSSASETYAEFIREKDENEKFLKSLLSVVLKARENILDIVKILPNGLKKHLDVFVNRLNSWDKLSNSQKLQLVFSIYSHIEKLNNTFHIDMQMLGNEEKREYKILYAGLSCGFALSENGENSGILIFREDKWEFIEDNSIKNSVKHAIDIFTKERPAEWLKLPFYKVR
ncbi:MAG: DUF3450 domain-containing protein [Candidatus Muirbacterium halophilum]|nr:DUF3450 domain-containing protein [Candidatus Muirbacterium halophilum]MCK9475904.1 DUF3450 domain-containing protein [Candidatus Muirbacterium halophilum]